MKSLIEELGEQCYDDVSKLLTELVDRTILGARSSTNEEDFIVYRSALNAEYADSVYRIILRARKARKKK